MPNINVPKKLESIRQDLSRVVNHVAEYSGIKNNEARKIQTTAVEIAVLSFQLASAARSVLGDPDPELSTLEEIKQAVDV